MNLTDNYPTIKSRVNSSNKIFDHVLVINAKNGDQKAMDLLVKRWHKRIIRQILRYTHQLDYAEDLAQESWEAIISGLGKLKNPEFFGSWAMRITSRKAFDWIRNNQKERLKEFEIDIREVGEDSSDDLIMLLRHGLRALNENQRIVLSLFYIEKHSLHEIAAILEIPQGTVKSRLFHAREHLKNILNGNKNENKK